MGDHYAVLGVDRHADENEIKRAHRRLTLQWHPDRHSGDPDAAERYRTINVAYNTLSDPVARARYEADLRSAASLELSQRFDGQSARDLLQGVFGDVFGTKKRQRRRGRDLRYTLTVALPQAVLGSTHSIEFDAPGPCEPCHGSGTRPGGQAPARCTICEGRGEVKGEGLLSRRTRCGRCDGTGLIHSDPCRKCRGKGTRRSPRQFSVRLPPGTASGAQRVLSGQGEPGRFGAVAGDLRVTVNVRPHPWLTRDGHDIRCELPVSVSEAARGAKVAVPTVDGPVDVEVPAGVKSGTRLRLRGKGVPATPDNAAADRRGRGDQLVTVRIEAPVLTTDAVGLSDALDALERASEREGVLPQRARLRAQIDPRPNPDLDPVVDHDPDRKPVR